MHSFTRSSTLVAAAVLITAYCGGPTEAEYQWRRQPGLIDVGSSHTAPISLPDTIQGAGSRTVVVQTRGSSSCTRAAGADVEYGHLAVTIRPMDLVATRGICTDDLAPHPRNVTINFNNVGTWTVRVVGRSFESNAVFETQVVVRDSP
jgi:hypothetical protein